MCVYHIVIVKFNIDSFPFGNLSGQSLKGTCLGIRDISPYIQIKNVYDLLGTCIFHKDRYTYIGYRPNNIDFQLSVC